MSRIENLGKCLVERYGLTRKDADSFVSEMFAVIRDNLEKERVVKVKGLGTFKLTDMNPRESVDVNTGERILIEGRSKVSFTPENAVRDRINSPFAQFETVDIGDDADFSAIDDKYKAAEDTDEPVESEPEKEPEADIAPPEPEIVPEEPEAAPVEEALPEPESTEETVPVEPEPTVEQAEEQPEQVVAHNPFCEELIREGITHSRKIIRLLHVMLALIIVAILVGAGYVGYKFYMGTLEPKADTPVKPAAKVVVVKKKAAAKKPVAAVAPADTVQKQAQEVDSVALMQAEYNKDARVRTGAYRIVGLAKVVTMQPGQTFLGICRANLGDGMECYVEVYNGGRKDFRAGDEIKIPLLKVKKRKNR